MGFKQIIEDNPAIVFGSVAILGFCAGWSAHVAVQVSGGLTTITSDRLKSLEALQSERDGLLAKVRESERSVTPDPKAPVPCFRVAGWPKGSWWLWGHFDSDWKPTEKDPKFPQYAPEVRFDSDRTFTAGSDHRTSDATKNQVSAQLAAPLVPEAIINVLGGDSTGYRATGNRRVSADGCMLHGDVGDNEGNHGKVHYLFMRDRYFVLPN